MRIKRDFKVAEKKLLGVMDMFIILIIVMVSQEYIYGAKTYKIIHFTYEEFIERH